MRTILPLFVLLQALTLSASSPSPVSIHFESDAVRVAGLSGRGVVYLEAARVAHGYQRDIVKTARQVTDDDADGAVDLPFGPRLPLHSVWIAVDLATGTSAVATPHPAGSVHSVEKLNFGQLEQLTRDGDYWMFLLVRPGVGSWALTVGDSGSEDAVQTHVDHKVRMTIARMQPLGSSPPAPRQLDRKDVMFVVDPLNLHVVELRNE